MQEILRERQRIPFLKRRHEYRAASHAVTFIACVRDPLDPVLRGIGVRIQKSQDLSRGLLRAVKVDGATRIPADEIEAFAARLKAEAGLAPVA